MIHVALDRTGFHLAHQRAMQPDLEVANFGEGQHVKSEGTREVSVQRYKGLGEMNPDQLWETTMNAETRTLLKVDLQDMAETEAIFSTLMGDVVEPRREFIQDNSLSANVDV